MFVRSTIRSIYSTNTRSTTLLPCLCRVRFASSTSTELPSQTENARSNLSKSLTARIDRLQTSILFAGQRLNDLTGYSGIEALKNQIEEQERKVSDSLQQVRDAKRAYETSIRVRSESQKEVNELLQRKNTWSSPDLERFTTLFRDDHSNSQNEEAAQKSLAEAEINADQSRTDLGNMILARYHEEQIWSDKIRRASTWGTWGLMGFNIFLFIIVQLGLEPWKRKRLVGSFEEKVRQVVHEERIAAELLTVSNSNLTLENADKAESEKDYTFLTDADHASSSLNHEGGNRLGFESSAADSTASSPLIEKQAPQEVAADFAVTPEGHHDPLDSSEETDKYMSRPLVGTSSTLLFPTSLHALRITAHELLSHLRHQIIPLSERVLHLWRRLFSSDRSLLRVEDVTTACFASGVIGLGVGIFCKS